MPQGNLKDMDEIRKKYSDIMNFTGRGRDIQQFVALSDFLMDEDNLSFLFIGCSNGDEILDCQEVFKSKFPNKVFNFRGIDAEKDAVSEAKKKKYLYETTIQQIDVLKEDFSVKYDIVICRNMLIYYDKKSVNEVINKIIFLSKKAYMLGRSDPLTFNIDENKTFDFDNRIFSK